MYERQQPLAGDMHHADTHQDTVTIDMPHLSRVVACHYEQVHVSTGAAWETGGYLGHK